MPAGEMGVPAGVARRATTGGGLVLPALVCGERGCVSSELAPLFWGVAGGCLRVAVRVCIPLLHDIPWWSPQPKLWRRTEAK